jgi:hypothetical protein
MSYIFKKTIDPENHFDNSTVEISIQASSVVLEDLLVEFENFLRGCGYNFNGRLDIVEEDDGNSEERT